MERKIVFLDIDGVLQPLSSQKRFKYCHGQIEQSPMLEKYKELQDKFGIDYSVYLQWNVAAVLYDWDKTAVTLLKLILNLTNAEIVISSDWRFDGFKAMKDLFTLQGLDKYLIDLTRTEDRCFEGKGGMLAIEEEFCDKMKAQHKEKHGKDAYLHYRTIEIYDWLNRNPDVKKWVAIDDLDLKGIDKNHFVKTCSRLSRLDEISAEKAIRILLP